MTTTEFQTYNINEAAPGDSWILLYYGQAGSGKTWFAGTAGERSFFINIGEGLETLKSPLFRSRYKGPALVVDLNENLMLLESQEVEVRGFDLTVKAVNYAFSRRDEWDTLIIDDVTALRRMALNKAMVLNQRADGKTKRADREEEYVKSEIGDYGVEMDMIKWFLGELIPELKALKKHLIMTAHERHIYGKPAKIGDPAPLQFVKPGFTGKTFPDEVQGYYDDIWRAECVGGAGNYVYRAVTNGNEVYAGKTRHNGIFESAERNPNFLNMLARIKEGKLHPSYLKR